VGDSGLRRNFFRLSVAKEILSRLFRSHRTLQRALWITGTLLCASLGWMLAAWLAVHSSLQLITLRLAWAGTLIVIAAASPLVWRRTASTFAEWVAREEKACRVPRLWSTVIGVPPSNPFYTRLDAEAAAALEARRGHFNYATRRRALGLVAIAAALCGVALGGRALLRQLKIQMALGWVDDAIVAQAPASIARGEVWTLHVRTLQPGPWVAEIQGVPVALTNGSLTLQALRVDTRYRIVTPWGKSRWQTVAVYEPVRWASLALTVQPPAYLQLPAETVDLLAPAAASGWSALSSTRLIVAGSLLSLRGRPAIEWSDPKHRNAWAAKTDEIDRVRPVEAAHHGLWTDLPLKVVPDAPPEIRWIRPEQDVAWGEKKTPAEIEASDDWNLAQVGLRIRRLGAAASVTRSLYEGRERHRISSFEIAPLNLPDGAQPGLYELTPWATDSAGQTTQGEKRFLEIKPAQIKEDPTGPSGKEPTSLRGVMVALLDTLRDWNREGRQARLGRVRLELDAMAKVAETPDFRAAAEHWKEALKDDATTQDVEKVVQEMASIQQKSESSTPKPGKPPETPPEPSETVSASDLEKIEMLQRAALDGGISPQLRDALQKRVQEQFQAKSDALKQQLPGAAPLVREIGMTQEKLTQQWSGDLAKAGLQQMEMLKDQLQGAPPRSAGQGDPSKSGLLDSIQGAVEAEHAVSEAQLNGMRELSSRDSSADWSSLGSASEKWNRALQSGLPSLKQRTKSALLQQLQQSGPSPAQSPSPADQATLANAIGAAAGRGDWDNVERFAQEAQWTPDMLSQLQQAKSAPATVQRALVRDLLGKMLNDSAEQSQKQNRLELQKVMPIDPSWEPDVDKYFQQLNRREGAP